MKQKLINYFSSISPLSDAEAKAIYESSVVKEYEKKHGTFERRTIRKKQLFCI